MSLELTTVLFEFIGTMVLIAFGTGLGASLSLNKTHNHGMPGAWLLITIGWGLAVIFGVAVAIEETGAHLNPAVTIGNAVNGNLDWSLVPFYLIGEFAGAFAGASLVVLMYYPHFKETTDVETVGIFATTPGIDNKIFNLIQEAIATFLFVLIISFATTYAPIWAVPIIVGLAVIGIGISFGGLTGYAINPARDLGPRFANTVLPIPNKSSSNWKYAWVPLVGPILGGIGAVFLFNLLV